ncbi:MAG TPA: RidA family protein [Alphaproteobacteria bacterium]|nr:RidA family protein [Alphaproteobacteria bacterium]
MEKEVIHIPKLSEILEQIGVPLSPVVKAGDFLFVSGLPPLDLESGKMLHGDIEVQTEQVMKNVAYALDCAGSSLEKVVKTNVFVTNAAYVNVINGIYRRYFPHDPPARTFVAMSSWPMEFDIEIDCAALA